MPIQPLTDAEIAAMRECLTPAFLREVPRPLFQGIARSLIELERARALLRRIEWLDHECVDGACPVCNGYEPTGISEVEGHKPGCELAALLGKP